MKHSKAYKAAAEKRGGSQLHTPEAAMKLVKEMASAKFDETIEVAVRLGVDPRKADQMVRGTVNLPNGTGKTARVLVFASGEKAEAAIATPDMMGKVGRLGRILGPRGLMPNPKTGTVTMDVAKAVADIKGGKIEFRVDRHANLQFIIGKASFTEQQLVENYFAALEEILRLKPAASKGRYVKKVAISATMSPSVLVDGTVTKPVE